ncbi:hypothetical protein F2P81_003922 [Scophthalmus maximus]|uniref:Uncharacterized protein n=1 Tax=Scophthalmus maximus TaxID=52904 RepID=A0A6A4TNE5_SCOMX|nr:hypothetical protein F2P81_003922 [Scophthalmus maximus]
MCYKESKPDETNAQVFAVQGFSLVDYSDSGETVWRTKTPAPHYDVLRKITENILVDSGPEVSYRLYFSDETVVKETCDEASPNNHSNEQSDDELVPSLRRTKSFMGRHVCLTWLNKPFLCPDVSLPGEQGSEDEESMSSLHDCTSTSQVQNLGVSPTGKQAAVKRWIPEEIAAVEIHLKRFIVRQDVPGMCSYCRCFIPNYASLDKSLRDIMSVVVGAGMVEIDGAGTMVVVFGAGMVEVDGAGTVVVVLGAVIQMIPGGASFDLDRRWFCSYYRVGTFLSRLVPLTLEDLDVRSPSTNSLSGFLSESGSFLFFCT